MQGRKYFQSRITELEELFNQNSQDFAVLEDLEEELLNRSTSRAKSLLDKVQKVLHSKPTKAQPDTEPQQKASDHEGESVINWDELIKNSLENPEPDSESNNTTIPIINKPTDVLDSWLALEVLSPQTYRKQDDLLHGYSTKAKLGSGYEPWFNNEKSRKNCNLYYIVYLGAVNMDSATKKLLEIYQDKRVEKTFKTGFAALGAILLDKKGIPLPETGLAISSFGWGYGQALKGDLSQLRHWGLAEDALIKGLEDRIYKSDANGQPIPLRMDDIYDAHGWLCQNAQIPDDDIVQPDFAVRLYQSFNKGEPESPLLNSFYLDDLQKAKTSIASGNSRGSLNRYLGITKPDNKFDLLKDKICLERILEPKNTPAGRWPSKGRFPLALLQQAAVNLASNELKAEHLFSVNGPPGTGKTTLLRDIAANIVVTRARKLSEYTSAEQAFNHAGKIKLGQGFVHLYKIDQAIQGHEILVASSNNKAVENISKELPQRDSIAKELEDFSYFRTVSDSLSGKENSTWGLIASALGNSTNRYDFASKGWWDDNAGLKKYFTHHRNNPSEDDPVPLIVEQDIPPETAEQAKENWEIAVSAFKKALSASEKSISCAQRVYESHKEISNKTTLIQEYEAQNKEIDMALSAERNTLGAAETALKNNQRHHETCQLQIDKSLEKKPSIFAWIFAHKKWKAWKAHHSKVKNELKESRKELQSQTNVVLELEKNIKALIARLNKIIEAINFEKQEIERLESVISDAQHIVSDSLVGNKLWALEHQDLQKSAPNFEDSVQFLRDEVFVRAMLLHKAFIDLSEKQIRQNLGAFISVLGGRKLPSDMAHLLPHLWSTLFLLSPVVSTTFASVGRMLKDLGQESIGWLLIDEAGQSSPQEAIGAIHRAKKVISVGDPLQIPPVVSLPDSLVEGISRYYGVDPSVWQAPFSSVQSLSDNANKYGAVIQRDLSDIFIGSPLLVHRRCQEPMFSISNNLAYSRLMVHATAPSQSALTPLIGTSQWFDITGSDSQDKWSRKEGEFVLEMISNALESQGDKADIFVITPFRIVAERMRHLMRENKDVLLHSGITETDKWIKKRIGTVHTFQGKEADTVFFLLGATSPNQNGARQWAASSVNILNVAVSRAKNNFYVVGNKKLWSNVGHMKLVADSLENQ